MPQAVTSPNAVHQHRPYQHSAFSNTAQQQQQEPQQQQHAPPPPRSYAPSTRDATGGSYVTLSDGRSAMVVVDPLTRKLSIPCEHIMETKAQQRQSIPSLCQLFLAGRCRQAHLCHQVHADPYAVHELRLQVERLPVCCVEHGDFDFVALMADISSNPNLSIRIANLTWNDGYVPIRSLSFTQGLRQQLLQAPVIRNDVLDLTDTHVNLCRLHIIDRCRFAEDCKFLHVCKHVMQHDMHCLSQPSPLLMTAAGNASSPGKFGHHHHHALPTYAPAAPTRATSEGAAATPPPTPPKNRSTLNLSLMEVEDGRATTPDSASDSSTERSIVSSGSFGSSQLQVSPHSVKKFRACGSWSYDPYCAAYTTLALPPGLTMTV